MAKVVAKTGVTKEPGYLYFVDKKGDVARTKMARRGHKTDKKQETVAEAGITREPGMLYFVDGDGNIACTKMARGRKKKR